MKVGNAVAFQRERSSPAPAAAVPPAFSRRRLAAAVGVATTVAAAGAMVLSVVCAEAASASANRRVTASGTHSGQANLNHSGIARLSSGMPKEVTTILSGDAPCGTALSAIKPAAGSTVMLARGCTYSGSLVVNAKSVTITAYGTGSNPVITLNRDGATVEVYGSNDTVENLSLVGVAPSTWTCGGAKTPAGYVDGVDLESGATGNTVSNVNATGFYTAVYIMAGSSSNIIKSDTFTANLMLGTNNSGGSSGAFGVLLWGNSNTIADNTISNNQACSLAYGYDGSAVEVYGGSNNSISSNSAANDNAFTELGSYSGHIATGNNFSYNTVTDGASTSAVTFLITRGTADVDGPVSSTVVSHNSVTLTKAGDNGAVSYAWQAGEGTLLTLTDNDLNLGSNQALYEDGGYINGGGNTFVGTCNPSSEC
jgi:hypothetical protein